MWQRSTGLLGNLIWSFLILSNLEKSIRFIIIIIIIIIIMIKFFYEMVVKSQDQMLKELK